MERVQGEPQGAWLRVVRSEPEGEAADDRLVAPAIGYQRWDRILFLHWEVEPELLQRRLPPRLELDTYEGRAFVSVTPFTLKHARLRGLPPLPFLRRFHELNVRTYVRLDGQAPGIWFFSLDATSAPASAVARLLTLPYCWASMSRDGVGAETFDSKRLLPTTRTGRFHAQWAQAQPERVAHPGTLEHFLLERYLLYAPGLAGSLVRGRVRHPPWRYSRARLTALEQSLDLADHLPPLEGAPLAHASPGVDVEFLPFQLV